MRRSIYSIKKSDMRRGNLTATVIDFQLLTVEFEISSIYYGLASWSVLVIHTQIIWVMGKYTKLNVASEIYQQIVLYIR